MSIFTYKVINISNIKKTNSLYKFIKSYDINNFEKSYYKLNTLNISNIVITPYKKTNNLNPFCVEYLTFISKYLDKNIYTVNLIKKRQIVQMDKPIYKKIINYDCDYVIPRINIK